MTGFPAFLEPLFGAAFGAGAFTATWIEAVAFVVAVASVVCNIRVDPLTWPLAIAGSLLYLLVFWHERLYGSAALQVLFAAVAVWGWRQWLHGTAADGAPLGVGWLGARGRWATVAAIALAWPATALVLGGATDTDVPWWDAFPTAASAVNQWLVGRKRVESWPVWIAVDAVALALYASRGLWLTALLYAVFLALACAGWRAWARLATQDGGRRAAPAAPAAAR